MFPFENFSFDALTTSGVLLAVVVGWALFRICRGRNSRCED